MMWDSNDKYRLWTVLRLNRNQMETGSTLSFLMDVLVEFDTNHQTNFVSQVQILLTEVETLLTDNPITLDNSDRVKSVSVTGMSMTFKDGTSRNRLNDVIQGKLTEIRSLLDPNRLLPFEHPYSSRVIV